MSARAKVVGKEFEGPGKTTTYRVDSVNGAVVKLVSMGSSGQRLELPTAIFPIAQRTGHIVKLRITVEDPYTRADWVEAFAEQGKSDLIVYEILRNSERNSNLDVPSCHRLHYLQMATEKIAKAYQVAGGNLSPRMEKPRRRRRVREELLQFA
jgi:hypothetical protein